MPESFGQALKRIREQQGLTLRQLEEKSGVSHSYLNQLENSATSKSGKSISPTLEIIAKISKGLNIPLGQMLLECGQLAEWDYNGTDPDAIARITVDLLRSFGINLDQNDVDSLKKFTSILAQSKSPKTLSAEELQDREIYVWDGGQFRSLDDALPDIPKNAIPTSDFVKIPIIGMVRAGIGGLAREDYQGYEYAERKDLNGHPISNYYWLRVRGDSMQPDIYPDDLALVCEQSDIDHSGQLAVVIVNDEEGVIKKVYKSVDSLMLHSVNPAYPPRMFNGPELNNVRIIGKVVEIKRKFK